MNVPRMLAFGQAPYRNLVAPARFDKSHGPPSGSDGALAMAIPDWMISAFALATAVFALYILVQSGAMGGVN